MIFYLSTVHAGPLLNISISWSHLVTVLILCSLTALITAKLTQIRVLDSLHTASKAPDDPFLQVLDRLPVGVCIINRSGSVTLNCTGQALLGQPINANVPRKSVAATYHLYRYGTDDLYPTESLPFFKSLEGESVRVDDIEIRTKDWQIPLEVYSIPVFDQEGQVMYAVTAFIDISERKASEEILDDYYQALQEEVAKRTDALYRSEQRLRILERAINESSNGIIIVDAQAPDYPMVYVNSGFERLTGYRVHEVLNHNCRFLQGTDQDQPNLQLLRDAVTKGEGCQVELRNYRRDGSLFWNEVTISPVHDIDGTLTHFLGIQSDITDLKRMTEELLVSKEAAEAANRAKSEFLANMSHELRTPLNAIMGFTQVLKRDPQLSPEQGYQVEIIYRSGEHLLSLINDVLDMSKIESGQLSLMEEHFDLLQFLKTILDMLQQKVHEKLLQLTTTVDPDIPNYLYGDEQKLRQVLINLLGNAIKFTEAGSINLQVSRVKDSSEIQPADPSPPLLIEFKVSDTGPGIPTLDLERIFLEFEQAEAGHKSKQGTGLGLSISRKYVQLMGGDIHVQSTVGVGTCFTFMVQLQPGQPSTLTHGTPKHILKLAPDQPNYRILVVDDQADNRCMLSQLLTWVGFAVQEATNGQEAIEKCQQWQPHLIWMDFRMPVMDGYTATQHIKAQPTSPVIIALTASAFADDRQLILASGCDDFVCKPIREDLVWEKMAQHLGVHYVFEETDVKAPTSTRPLYFPVTGQDLSVEELKDLSLEWLQHLHQAAICGDDTMISLLIQQLPDTSAPLALKLTSLMVDLRLDVISDRVQEVLDQTSEIEPEALLS